MDNFGKWIWLAVRAPIVLVVLWFNINLWTLDTADPEAPVDALDALSVHLRAGAGDDMQALFPEGYSITHALVGFAWVDVALGAEPGTPEHEHALSEARWMEQRVASPDGYRIFPENGSPKYGAFYRGYLAWLRGGILLADPSDSPEEVAQFQQDTEEIAAAFRASETPYPRVVSPHGVARGQRVSGRRVGAARQAVRATLSGGYRTLGADGAQAHGPAPRYDSALG